ncbi:MAG: transketolase [Lachnospiraceae bacterium]|nr:transketolase [Lachnospiraceae bacterium]
MGLSEERQKELEQICLESRVELIELLHKKQTGHPGGSLSACEIMTVLYQEKAKISPDTLQDKDRDRIILSKGHAAPILYMALAKAGFIPQEELSTLRDLNTRLQGHPSSHALEAVELTTGPLGLGMSAGLGMALSLKLDGSPATVYVVAGDGELNEGACWEAAMCAAKFGADNLILIVDRNHVQLDGTSEEIMPMGDLGEKFRVFGWEVYTCDGHHVGELCDCIDRAKERKGKPNVIIAETVKGKGVSFMEGKNIWHGKPIDDASYAQAMKELKGGKEG